MSSVDHSTVLALRLRQETCALHRQREQLVRRNAELAAALAEAKEVAAEVRLRAEWREAATRDGHGMANRMMARMEEAKAKEEATRLGEGAGGEGHVA